MGFGFGPCCVYLATPQTLNPKPRVRLSPDLVSFTVTAGACEAEGPRRMDSYCPPVGFRV